ncbi:MAG: hypothetical protein KDA57_22530 [Planctomycetales bacterium]|nr:hypothetical protein [Planctomycetales bacterium]
MNSNHVRQRALRLLLDHEHEPPSVIHNAIIDMRRNAERGDENVLYQLLDHYDPMVVAATLYTLCEVHDQRATLRSVLEGLVVNGDTREIEDLDKPIQCMAINLLALSGKRDGVAVAKIIQVAEDRHAADTARACAWERLAQLFGAEWPRDATEELMLRPESDASDRIRTCIRNKVDGPKAD